MRLRWFLSSTVREASDLTKHVRKLLNAQRDILPPQAVDTVEASLKETCTALNTAVDTATIRAAATQLETTANKWLKPYPNAVWRENIEVFLVAIVIAMGIRTFFLQPFKIPTGSMQPTLFGMTVKSVADDPNYKMPETGGRIADALLRGRFYHEWIADADGEVLGVGAPQHLSMFINKRQVAVQYAGQSAPTVKTFWFTPEDAGGGRDLFTTDQLDDGRYVQTLYRGKQFHKGEPIVRIIDTTGDHLFVDRLTYNFRKPNRGEIIVFKTKGIEGLDQSQFYIKRLVGLPNDQLSICKVNPTDPRPQHACINGKPLTAADPHFENVYSFDPKQEPQDSHYSGHILASGGWSGGRPVLLTEDDRFHVRPEHYAVFGDNTANSLDSRYWGDLPEENVIGKSWFVYWPIGSRFGWGQR
ncbi:MAG: Signal peptidase [Verrucomicrobiales bacterium]|nr:Signal peptidase [Verrucomicrobiales bacterium]